MWETVLLFPTAEMPPRWSQNTDRRLSPRVLGRGVGTVIALFAQTGTSLCQPVSTLPCCAKQGGFFYCIFYTILQFFHFCYQLGKISLIPLWHQSFVHMSTHTCSHGRHSHSALPYLVGSSSSSHILCWRTPIELRGKCWLASPDISQTCRLLEILPENFLVDCHLFTVGTDFEPEWCGAKFSPM